MAQKNQTSQCAIMLSFHSLKVLLWALSVLSVFIAYASSVYGHATIGSLPYAMH